MPKIIIGKKSRIFLGIVLVLAMIGLSGTAAFFYYQYRQEQLRNPFSEVEYLTRRIGKFMVLPEEPATLATVTEKEQLADQGFFKSAENGDKVLIFVNAGKAILYRPTLNKVVDVASVRTLEEQEPEAVDESTVAMVEVYNGTFVTGLAGSVADQLEDMENLRLQITSSKDARLRNYTDTLVVDLAGNNPSRAQRIADELGGKVGRLPAGEASPAADLLIIVGINYVNSR